ncbi:MULTISPECIES: hypothetical protein [Paenibacillus]|uniref:hypothetical protein n=1 Tax=Paenibacillus TaxID=44249 RepID=UPI000FD8BA02|nr:MULTISPECIES: hypothetical protein [Paenibacillus]
MKKLSFVLASSVISAALLAGSPASALPAQGAQSSSLLHLGSPSEITPQQTLVNAGNYTINGGQGSTSFHFSKTVDTAVRIYVRNDSAKPVKLYLVSPQNVNWLDRTLQPGEAVTSEPTWGKGQVGTWTFKYTTSDGSNGSIYLSVKDDV